MPEQPKNPEKKLRRETGICKSCTCSKSYSEFADELVSTGSNTKPIRIRVIRCIYCICQILHQSTNGKRWIAFLRSALFKVWQDRILHFRKHTWIVESKALNRICLNTSESRNGKSSIDSSGFQNGVELGSTALFIVGTKFVDEIASFDMFTHPHEFGIELVPSGPSTASRILRRIDGLIRGFTAFTNSPSK